MAIQFLSQASAFNSGADLWVTAEKIDSTFGPLMDWYLNFQIAKSTIHQTAVRSQVIEKILLDSELPTPQIKTAPTQSLMICAENLVPAKWIIIFPRKQDLTLWCQEIYDRWKGLNFPSIRIFLPTGTTPAEFEKVWLAVGGTDQISVVADTNG